MTRKNTTTENLWDTLTAVLRGKFTAIQAHFKTRERHQVNNLFFNLKQQKNKRI